jgi:hypothetical protein
MTERERIDQRPSAEPATQRECRSMTCMDLMADKPTCCLPSGAKDKGWELAL